jgi:hypothetical protein
MSDFKIKMLLSALSAVVFSFIIILLALVLPVETKKKEVYNAAPQSHLEKVSEILKNKLGR